MNRPRSLTLTLVLLALAPGCSSGSAPATEAAVEQAPRDAAAPGGAPEAVSEEQKATSASEREVDGAAAPEAEPAPAPADGDAPARSQSRSAKAKDDALAGTRVEIAEPMINGGLSRDIIRRKAQDHEDDIRACHAKSLVAHPELYGSVALKLKVDARGVVKDVELGDASELDERELVDCLLELVSGWSFADATGKADVELRFELSEP